MTRKIVWIATLSFVGVAAAAGSATAQYRGYGYGYDSGPNYFESSPAYDPFYNEGGPQGGQGGYDQRDYPPPPPRDYSAPRGGSGGSGGYADDRGVPPVYHAYGDGQGQGQPYYPDQGQAYDAGGGGYDLGENANNRTMVEVPNPTKQPPGTIVIDTGSRHLYLVEHNGQALEYGIGVGREGFAWKGTAHVQRKAEWPGWTPPAEMLKRRPDLPLHMEGGIDNPLGARAMYLYNGKGDTGFRIHGTNEPDTIGKAVSSGCIRMMNADVIDLYNRVPVGTRVVVL